MDSFVSVSLSLLLATKFLNDDLAVHHLAASGACAGAGTSRAVTVTAAIPNPAVGYTSASKAGTGTCPPTDSSTSADAQHSVLRLIGNTTMRIVQ